MGTATYFILNVSVLIIVLAAFWRYLLRDTKTWWKLALFMIPLTIIFDSLCIYLGMFWYSPDTISGLKLGPMPIEDLLYTVVAITIVPALWNIYEKKEKEHDA